MIDIDDVIVRTAFAIDDGCDWTAHHIWRMNTRRRMKLGIYEQAPAKPKISVIKLEPLKKPKGRKSRKKNKALGESE
ncbi:hypothetical protein [Pragia fontium]|uniref:hypothetical protein n=1 Tax=Pragia fontium TaxID=82985 RepID=UPI00064A6856|nr:hypothetical protein [Pragia fontium]AKJ41522.1 hypothetical protein QQ39_05030 [Pragia fontium]